MTPQERQLMVQLFDRLATLENAPRDPDAEAMIREGLRRAPNAAYALVQTVLLQDEALKAANAHIQEYEQRYGPLQPQQGEQPRGFLDNVRDNLFGREEPRGSVPRVSQGGAPSGAPMGAPPGYRPDPWGQGGQGGYQQGGYQQGAPMQAPPQQGSGGSFLGTAAAAAAGMIGGSLLMGGISRAMGGGQQPSSPSRAFDEPGGAGGAPWGGNAAGGDLSRQAGLDDITGRGGSGGGSQRAGLFDSPQDNSEGDSDSDDSHDGDSFDGDDTEEA